MKQHLRSTALTLCALLTCGALASAADSKPAGQSPEEAAMMAAWQAAMAVGPQHQMLAARAGNWTVETKMWMAPGAPPQTSAGKTTREMIMGGRVLTETYAGEMMGMPFNGMGMSGYDNVEGHFWATWVDDSSTALFTSTGSWDAATKTMTMKGQMTDMMTKKVLPIREVFVIGADREVFSWYETRDGVEHQGMEITYTRVK
jgi:hypothetical protein